MQQPRVTFRHIILAMRHHRVPTTPGQEHTLAAIIIFFFPLLILGFFGGLVATGVFGTFLSFFIVIGSVFIGLVAAVLLWLVWRFRGIARVLRAEQAAGAPLPVPTRSGTAYFGRAGELLLLFVPLVVLLVFVPKQDSMWIQIVWILLVGTVLSFVRLWKRDRSRRLR